MCIFVLCQKYKQRVVKFYQCVQISSVIVTLKTTHFVLVENSRVCKIIQKYVQSDMTINTNNTFALTVMATNNYPKIWIG